jgi:MFS transporter, SP family, sugar:H+ symporter
MLYRILLGMALQSLQQLTGANYFFYYGTTIFSGVGIQNSFGMLPGFYLNNKLN